MIGDVDVIVDVIVIVPVIVAVHVNGNAPVAVIDLPLTVSGTTTSTHGSPASTHSVADTGRSGVDQLLGRVTTRCACLSLSTYPNRNGSRRTFCDFQSSMNASSWRLSCAPSRNAPV
jgi:hypothetical protein